MIHRINQAIADDLARALLDLSRETMSESRTRLLDTQRMSKEELTRELDAGDKEAGTTERHTSWDGQVLKVEWAEPVSREITVKSGNLEITVTEKPRMVSNLQQVASRLGQLKHDSEYDAKKLLTRVDSAFVRKDAAFAKSHQFLDGHEKDLADVEGFIEQIEQATNGDPT